MEVRILNGLLMDVQSLLFDLELTGRKSRHRTRFIKLLSEQLELIQEEEVEIVEAMAEKDENGEPIYTEEEPGVKNYKIPEDKRAQVAQDRRDLYNEEFVIEGSANKTMLLTIREILDDYPRELSGEEAVIYEELCTQFKVDEVIEEDE